MKQILHPAEGVSEGMQARVEPGQVPHTHPSHKNL